MISGSTIFIYRGSFSDPQWQWRLLTYAIPLDRRPEDLKIVCDRSNDILYLVYTFFPTHFEGHIRFTRSLDGGLTWSESMTLSGLQCSTAQIALGPEGELHLVWEDYARDLLVGRTSTDQGVSFGPEFQVAAIHDNYGFGPSGWETNFGGSATVANMPCMEYPAFIGLAVDTTLGPRRGALYVTWTEHGVGTVQTEPDRTFAEVEPNNSLANATPIAFGEDTHGFMGSADLPPYTGDCDYFTFEGTAGTTIRVTGGATYCDPQYGCVDWSLNFKIHCGSAPTPLTTVGCGQVFSGFGPPIKPVLYTLPTTGRYYLTLACSGPGSISYHLSLREYVIAPDQPARDHRDVLLSSSADGGATWSPKVRVNDDPPLYDNSIPAVAVDGQGRVHVAWYDRREQPECGGRVHTYWTWSDDGGATFQPAQRVSEQPSDGGTFTASSSIDRWTPGDRMALHAEGDRVHLLWTYVPIGGGGDIYGVVISDLPTGTLVSRFEAEAVEGRVALRWGLAAAAQVNEFRIHRATGASEEYTPVAEIAASGHREYAWHDPDVAPDVRYRYRLEVLGNDGTLEWEGPVEVAFPARPTSLRWLEAVPNPFDDVVELGLESGTPGATRVRVYDVSGHLIAELRPEVQEGRAWVRWNGRTRSGSAAAPGVYLVLAESGRERAIRRVIRMR